MVFTYKLALILNMKNRFSDI